MAGDPNEAQLWEEGLDGFASTPWTVPMGRWGGRTGDTLIAELDGLQIVDLSSGDHQPLPQPSGRTHALHPTVGHGRYADGSAGDLAVYDIASGWWEETAPPDGATVTWKAFDGPDHLVANAREADGTEVLLHIELPGGATETFERPSLGARSGSPTTVGARAHWTEWSQEGTTARMLAAPLTVVR